MSVVAGNPIDPLGRTVANPTSKSSIQNDGQRYYLVSMNRIFSLAAWPVLTDPEAVRILSSIDLPGDLPKPKNTPPRPTPLVVSSTAGLNLIIKLTLQDLPPDASAQVAMIMDALGQAERYTNAADTNSVISQTDAYFTAGQGLIALGCQYPTVTFGKAVNNVRNWELATLRIYEGSFIGPGDADRIVSAKLVIPAGCRNAELTRLPWK